MRLGVLFSGGKDSVFACHRAMERDQVACLITLLSENEDSYMFHTPNVRWAEIQARSMGIPILLRRTRGEKESELQDLRAALLAAAGRYSISGVVTGAIESVYQASRVQRICYDLGLWCFNPLWQADQVEYLRMLIREGFEVLISGVFAYPLDSSWLGSRLTEERIDELEALQRRYGINPSGEGGEIETFVLDAPLFRERIEIVRASVSYSGYRGRLQIEEARLVEG